MLFKKIVLGVVSLLLSIHLFGAQQNINSQNNAYRLYITDIKRVTHNNWLGVPNSVDCTVYWEVYREVGQNTKPVNVSEMDEYTIICNPKGASNSQIIQGNAHGNFYTFKALKVGQGYGVIVKGLKQNQVVAQSDSASILTGKELRATGALSISRWYRWIPFNGRIPMAVIGRGNVFDGATKAGKIAFHLIWNFFIAGVVIWMFYCRSHLNLNKIFPMEKNIRIGRGFQDIYQRSISREFMDIISSWRSLVENVNEHMRKELETGTHKKIEEIEMENVRFWRKEGASKVRDLLKRITNPVTKFNRYSTVRIIQAGLENHELGGFRWLEASKEVDRAIENRAASELEQLKRESYLEWLWNMGTLAPILGLFGTATGISHAFAALTMIRSEITQTTLVRRLAGGIFEALWTTIEGLFVGIFLMLLYYYYQNKLNWIYSKWEEIYVHITQKL